MNRQAATMPAHAYALSWKQLSADQRDADLFRVYTATRLAGIKPHARMMLLSGLAGFNRSI
jgi:hypothetical protein